MIIYKVGQLHCKIHYLIIHEENSKEAMFKEVLYPVNKILLHKHFPRFS